MTSADQPAKPFSYDVFLSHNQADKPRVRRLAERLRAAAPFKFGTRNSEFGIPRLCLSPAALGSDWVGLERSTVLFRDPANAGRRSLLWWREHPSPQHQQRERLLQSSVFDLARKNSQPLLIKKRGTAKSRMDTSLRGLQVHLERAVKFRDNLDPPTKGPLCLA